MKMMKIERVDPCAVAIPHRLRAVDSAKVKQIGESMAAIGLQQPITVWSPEDGDCELIAGAHRLQAAVNLGWDWIDVVFHDDWSDIDRQLWEIDENLMRAELTPTQQAEHLAKRKELWAQREVSAQAAPKPQGGRPSGFASETAAATGINKSTVNRAVSRANAIPEDVRDQIRGTDLDKGVYLDSIKGMTPDDQRIKVANALRHPPAPGPKPDQFASLMRDWNKANADERGKFLRWLNNTGKVGGMAIDEVVERLRWGLRDGRIREEDRGFVMGVLRQSKTGRWWPTPAQEGLMHRLVDELMAEPVIDTEDGGADG